MMKPIVCKQCGVLGHYRYQCFKKPPKKKAKPVVIKRKYISKKIDWKWIETKNKWFKANPPVSGYYYCWYCQCVLAKDDELNDFGVATITLDHKSPKGNYKGLSLKYDITNLVPACYKCNSLKGSRSYESFCREFAPHRLKLDGQE